MKLLYNLDLRNYDDGWKHSARHSARAIIQFENNKIALVHSKKFNYYKFPGGGIHDDEDKPSAMIREVREETGLIVIPETIEEFGYIHRTEKSNYLENTVFEQDSFYYLCKVENQITAQELDDYEEEAEFELKIVTYDEAIRENRLYNTDNSLNLVMIARDTKVLELLSGRESIPSVPMAEYLLDLAEKKNPGVWKNHSIAVAEAARKIAVAVNDAGGSMDSEKAYVVGLLHDIGRQEGYTYLRHVYDGYRFLKSLGYEPAGKICLTHSFNIKNMEEYIGKNDLSEADYKVLSVLIDECEFDDYDRLIQLLDATCGADGTVCLEDRMNDVKTRYGYYPEGKWNKNFELKEYFEKLMKKDLYEVIKNNQ